MTHLPFEDYNLMKIILKNSLNNYKKYKDTFVASLCNKLVLYPGTYWFDKYAKPRGITKPCYVRYSDKFQTLWNEYRQELHKLFNLYICNDPDIEEEIQLF